MLKACLSTKDLPKCCDNWQFKEYKEAKTKEKWEDYHVYLEKKFPQETTNI